MAIDLLTCEKSKNTERLRRHEWNSSFLSCLQIRKQTYAATQMFEASLVFHNYLFSYAYLSKLVCNLTVFYF